MSLPYKIRADMQVNGDRRKLVLAATLNEKPEHLGLKLAAYLLFWDKELTVEASGQHPALAGQEFRPDLMGTDITGSISTWIECGQTTQHKLLKVTRRWREAAVAVFKETRLQAERFREALEAEVPTAARIHIYYWEEGRFSEWMHCLSEKTEIIGEAGGLNFNLVVNERVYLDDLKLC